MEAEQARVIKFQSLCDLGLQLLSGNSSCRSSIKLVDIINLLESRDSGYRKVAMILIYLLIESSEIEWSQVGDILSCTVVEESLALVTLAKDHKLESQIKELLTPILGSTKSSQSDQAVKSQKYHFTVTPSPVIYHFPDGKFTNSLQSLTKRDLREILSSKSLHLCPDPRHSIFVIPRPARRERKSVSKSHTYIQLPEQKSKSSINLDSGSKQADQRSVKPRPRFQSEIDQSQLFQSNVHSPVKTPTFGSSVMLNRTRSGVVEFRLKAVKPNRNIAFTPQANKVDKNLSFFKLARGYSLALMENTPVPVTPTNKHAHSRKALQLQRITSFRSQLQPSSKSTVLEVDIEAAELTRLHSDADH